MSLRRTQELVYRALMKNAVNCDHRKCALPAFPLLIRCERACWDGIQSFVDTQLIHSTDESSSVREASYVDDEICAAWSCRLSQTGGLTGTSAHAPCPYGRLRLSL